MCSPHSHNINELPQSRADLDTFKHDLTRAITGAYPTPGRTTSYHRVRAALVRWDVDDTNAEKSVEEMENAFQVYYGFECKRFVIEARSAKITPERSLQKICIEVGYTGEKGDLMIFYYAGRSVWDPRPRALRFQSGPYSVTENNSSSQKVARASADFTSQSRANLDSVSDSAVLYLLDTGIRAAGTPVNTDADREIFAASFLKIDPVPTATTNSNSSGDNNGNSNWTKELCRHLRNASRRNEPMTVAQLHGEMIQSLAEIGADGQRKLPVVPVHSQLISPMKGGSIVLAPESFRKWTGFGEFTEPDKGSQSGSDSHSDLVFSKVSKDHASPLEFGQQDHEHELTQAQEYRKPMSLISVRLHFESPIKGALPPLPVISVLVEELRRWLRELIDTTTTTITTHLPLLKPKSLTKIQLSAYCSPIPEPGPTHYPSFSGMRPTPASGPASGVVLLILLPIEVWDGMRADPAYSFVRFAMSAT